MEKRMSFTIVGKSPLLTHNPASMSGANKSSSKAAKVIPSPEDEARKGLYINDAGEFCIPSIGIRNGFIEASKRWRGSWQKGKQTLKGDVSHIVIEQELLTIYTANGETAKDYAVDTRRAVVQHNGILRSRPRFDDWMVAFEFIYDSDLLPDDEPTIRTLFTSVLNDAGNRIGLGDYRPQKTGWFGRYQVRE
jgi:hypothetical protein